MSPIVAELVVKTGPSHQVSATLTVISGDKLVCICGVAALIDGRHVSKQLPVIRKALTCYKLLEVLLKEIECCPGLMSSQRLADGQRCTHCGRTSPSSKGNSHGPSLPYVDRQLYSNYVPPFL